MSITYQSLLGYRDGAKKLHIHLTEILSTASHPPYQHRHDAEEAFYVLEGEAEYRFGGKTIKAGPGDVVFIPSGVLHAEINYLTPSMRYLTVRTVEPADEPCCCGQDRQRDFLRPKSHPSRPPDGTPNLQSDAAER
jgi:quercetin dioxygenase-like cupin family protein